jgi:hypothetical protein
MHDALPPARPPARLALDTGHRPGCSVDNRRERLFIGPARRMLLRDKGFTLPESRAYQVMMLTMMLVVFAAPYAHELPQRAKRPFNGWPLSKFRRQRDIDNISRIT